MDYFPVGLIPIMLMMFGVPAAIVTVMFVIANSRKNQRERERHLRALEKIAKSRDGQVGRDH